MFNKKLIAFMIVFLCGLCNAFALPEQKSISTIQLHFPEKLVGSVTLLRDDANEPTGVMWSAKAAGAVNVPVIPRTVICLNLNNDVLKNPDRLQNIPVKGIQALHLGIYSMTDEETDATNKCLTKIGRFQEIKFLFLDSSDATDDALKVVESLPNLRVISVEATRINGACFKSFAKLPNLLKVNAQRCHFEEANFKYLAQSPKLEHLELRWTNISSKGLRLLAQSKSLRYLRLAKGKNITDADSEILASMPQLNEVCLADCPSLTNKTVKNLSQLKNLKSLNLANAHIDDNCIPSLKKLTKLEYLDVVDTDVSEAGLLKLNCPNLGRLDLTGRRFLPDFQTRLSKHFPKLRWMLKPRGNSNDDDVNFLLSH